MSMRTAAVVLLASLGLTPALGADPSPGVHCEGIYCRETEDRDWHVRIAGEVISPAGVYVVVSGADGRVIFRGLVPRGQYPPDSPWKVKVPKDGIAGDYLLTLFGTQGDYGTIQTPYTDLPFEVYGKEVNGRTFLQVIPQGTARNKPAHAPGELFFQVPAGSEEVTITQGSAWTLHASDGSIVFDADKQGKVETNPSNKRKSWTGAFQGKPGTTYILGHSLCWFYASPRLYVAVSPERWFLPDPKLKLDPAWWRQTK